MEEKMSNGITVVKRNGNVEPLMLEKIHDMVNCACVGLANVSASQIEMNSGLQFYAGITTDEIQQILVKSASDLISLDHPNYQYVAARLLLFSIRKQVYGGRIDLPHLEEHINRCVQLNVYDPVVYENYSKEEINELNDYIDHDRDFIFTYAGLRQVVDKYLVQDRSNGRLYETPQFTYMMIALTGFANYPKATRLSYVKRFYDAISRHKINLPTPIIAGIRTKEANSASCVLIDPADDAESLAASAHAMIRYICKKAGIGINGGRWRGIGSKIRGGESVSTGAIPFLKFFESSLKAFHQGGIRAAAATVYFPIWHQEIESIIVLKNNKGTDENRVRKLDYNIQLSKIFLERFISDGEITLFSPHYVTDLYDAFYDSRGTDRFDELYVKYEADASIPQKKISARKLILDLISERFETGRVYLMFVDHANSHSPFKDNIYMSNLCVAGDTKIWIMYSDNQKSLEVSSKIEIEKLDYYLNNPKYDNVQVRSYNTESNEKEWKLITAFAQTSPKAKVMKITDGETGKNIIVTPDHKVFTKKRGYVMAKELTETDELVINSTDMWQKKGEKMLTIEHLDEEIPVYDITVEGTHNFYANDILVHNCTEILEPTVPIYHIDDETGEIALCTLSSFNLGIIKSDKELEGLADLTVRFLDELIDLQHYPVRAAEIATKARRMLGVGVIGLAHYLAKLNYTYEQPEAWKAVHGLSESIQYYMLKASNNLAKEKGHCEYFGRTKYSDGILPIDTYKKDVDEICNEPLQHDWESLRQEILQYGLRNSTCTTILPSESSSIVTNATNGIEPPRGLLSYKKSKKGPVKQIVPQYSTLKNNYTLLWNMKNNKGYFNIVSLFIKFFDHSVSSNWNYNPENFPNNEIPMSEIVDDLFYCFRYGHKTAYYCNTYDGRIEGEAYDEPEKNLDQLIETILEGDEVCDSCAI
jgi:ribonucleotide reductase alpha subunit